MQSILATSNVLTKTIDENFIILRLNFNKVADQKTEFFAVNSKGLNIRKGLLQQIPKKDTNIRTQRRELSRIKMMKEKPDRGNTYNQV